MSNEQIDKSVQDLFEGAENHPSFIETRETMGAELNKLSIENLTKYFWVFGYLSAIKDMKDINEAEEAP